ncbi:PepSY-associated TM helix domain-containing protein [Nocardia callitridis]|uniref:PepSY domain-containing protein n=1 Tax=Nocardia callitridis TaxID=648753 RepID=A0ABP9L210_9NOCA
MSTTQETRPDDERSTPPSRPETGSVPAARGGLVALALRLHFYAGVFVAPFILIAAITGGLYALAPTLESITSRDLLHVEPSGTPTPLSEQVHNAVGSQPDKNLVAVAPAGGPNDSTRVLFDDPTLGESERRAVFVDPYTGHILGDTVVYGSGGALPLRTWIDNLHRSLHLGEPGRIYSELAASWLWVIAAAGLVIWVRRVRARRTRNSVGWLLRPDRSRSGRNRTVNWHGAVGIWLLPLLLLLSATGMTWSTYAGEHVTQLREQLSWTTPAVSTALPGSAVPTHDSSAEHHHGGAAEMGADQGEAMRHVHQLDAVYATARANGVTKAAEITIPTARDQAFTVTERRKSGTYSVDSVAVDGATGAVTDALPYSDWPLIAKLSNWGIQFHMGLMFGLANQLLLLAAMVGLVTVVARGYLMWWRRRPTRTRTDAATTLVGRPPRRGSLRASSPQLIATAVLAAALIGWFAPLLGLSLLAFLAVDLTLAAASHLRKA